MVPQSICNKTYLINNLFLLIIDYPFIYLPCCHVGLMYTMTNKKLSPPTQSLTISILPNYTIYDHPILFQILYLILEMI